MNVLNDYESTSFLATNNARYPRPYIFFTGYMEVTSVIVYASTRNGWHAYRVLKNLTPTFQ